MFSPACRMGKFVCVRVCPSCGAAQMMHDTTEREPTVRLLVPHGQAGAMLGHKRSIIK